MAVNCARAIGHLQAPAIIAHSEKLQGIIAFGKNKKPIKLLHNRLSQVECSILMTHTCRILTVFICPNASNLTNRYRDVVLDGRTDVKIVFLQLYWGIKENGCMVKQLQPLIHTLPAFSVIWKDLLYNHICSISLKSRSSLSLPHFEPFGKIISYSIF